MGTQDSPPVERPEVFDSDHITQKLVRIDREEDCGTRCSTRHGIEAHRVVYEDFVEAQEQTVREVLDAIGVDAPADLACLPRCWTARPTSSRTSGSSATSRGEP